MYQLDKNDFKVPIIFGSLVGHWNETRPMVFTSHFSMNFLCSVQSKKEIEFQQKILEIAKEGCLNRVDLIESQQVGATNRKCNTFDPLNILNIQSNFGGKATSAKLSDMLLHMRNKYDDIQQFNHPANTCEDSVPEEDQAFITEPTGKLPERFVFSTMATPGPHCILIYDPVSKQIFKKLITVNPRETSKEFVPHKLELE